ncbi:MAG TPA: ArsC/Spx/MgsR family protein [Flavobacteriales bacterium]|nr:ArsC/Spx/MgsR family protein [Flavobacteriales bacterium]
MSETVLIYYNPACSKCMYALEFLKERGITPELIEYLSQTPSVGELELLLQKLGLRPYDIIRTSENLFIEKYSHKQYNDNELLQIIVENPALLQRPILVKKEMAVVGRSDQALLKII